MASGSPFFVTEVVPLRLADGTARQENPDAGAFLGRTGRPLVGIAGWRGMGQPGPW